ncbi:MULTISPECIES: hypothetical protein [unclassified Bradyrhizobium]|uniref:hypothetical protein n=1 Tax=unclassified Bradyrhizobium TaxID=2631580 RepID=UPI00140A1475|nr:hypothetical protein [Bradyrhizobium sp. 2S1]MCK7666574.1 hypothetical protein [Bradyrhizobium sp. 2S1]
MVGLRRDRDRIDRHRLRPPEAVRDRRRGHRPWCDGYSDFNALHSGKHNAAVEMIAFDILVLDGDDLRDLPLSMRKTNPAAAPCAPAEGIFLSDYE